MFGMDSTVLMFIALAGLSAGAVAYAFLFKSIENEKKADRRLQTVKSAETDRSVVRAARDRANEAQKRRKSIQDSLKELDEKQKTQDRNTRKPPLRIQIRQAGLQVPVERFYVYSGICGVVLTLLAFIVGAPFLLLPGVLIAGSIGVPRWFVSFKRARRVKAFLNEFPNALDIIVRAVKSGLPLNDGIRLIASEAPEPVKSEFRRIVEAQQLGLSIPEAAMRMGETMPCPEANFFGIVIQIQSQAGGNLSKVLRDRKKMKAKVQALSMEAKASAAIIGALPFIVALLVYLSSPGFIMPLFITSTGHMILGVSGIWMSIGIFVMRKMINFEV